MKETISLSVYLRKFLIIFAILLISSIIVLVVGYHDNSDVRGWWPVVVIFEIIIYGIYTALFLLIDKNSPMSINYIIVYNSILGFIIIFLGIAYYTINIDWLAINNGKKSLTLFQTIINSDITYYTLLVFFLVLYSVIIFNLKWKKMKVSKNKIKI